MTTYPCNVDTTALKKVESGFVAGFDEVIEICKVALAVVPQNVALSQIPVNQVRFFVQPFHYARYLKQKMFILWNI